MNFLFGNGLKHFINFFLLWINLANCILPYALTPNNTCVNILIDFNNCGAVGYVCGVNDTSCSGGVCSGAPAVQLVGASFVWTAAVNGSVDDAFFGVSLPFNITLYSTTTNYVYVTSNGVSLKSFLLLFIENYR
jgi:hypothetical protein